MCLTCGGMVGDTAAEAVADAMSGAGKLPDYSSWGMTLGQSATDFTRSKLTPNDMGKIPSGYDRWIRYDDGKWYYLTEGGELFGAIAQAYLCSGCAHELFLAQPEAFKKKAAWLYGGWPGDGWDGTGNQKGLFSGTTMSPNVPVLMPEEAVNIAIANGGINPSIAPPPSSKEPDKPTKVFAPKSKSSQGGNKDEGVVEPVSTASSWGTTVLWTAVIGGAGYAFWRLLIRGR
jgi:hypothetical protein